MGVAKYTRSPTPPPQTKSLYYLNYWSYYSSAQSVHSIDNWQRAERAQGQPIENWGSLFVGEQARLY